MDFSLLKTTAAAATTTKVTHNILRLRKYVSTLVLTANISTNARRLLWFGTSNTTGSCTTTTTNFQRPSDITDCFTSSCRYHLQSRTILKSYANTGSCNAIIFSTVRDSIRSNSNCSNSRSRHRITNAFRSKILIHTTANSCSVSASSTSANAVISAPSSTTDSISNSHSNKGEIDPSSASLPPESKKQSTGIVKRLREQEAQESSTLYFKYTNRTKAFETIDGNLSTKAEADEEVSTNIKVNCQKQHQPQRYDKENHDLRNLPTIDIAGEMLRQWMEETLESALADGDNTKAEDRIRAADEPALQVKLNLPKDASLKLDQKAPYCFFHFASHAAASMAIATLTGSTDGGYILEHQKALRLQQQKQQLETQESAFPSSPKDGEDLFSSNEIDKSQSTEDTNSPDDALSLFTPSIGLYLHWTNDYVHPALSSDERNVIISEAKDSCTDCWFCLASSACQKHLITGVYDTCYMQIAKGPVHPGHVLIIPVKHISQGALRDASVTAEMEDLKMKLRHHALIAYNADLFVFERAIQTTGGYHAHVQCIPVSRTIGLQLISTLLAEGRKYGLEIREINTDLELNAILSASDDDKDATYEGGYFYAEVPIFGREFKRLIHKVKISTPTLSGRKRSRVKMEFGRNVLALVLEDPKIADWENCVVDAEQEAAMAAQFRESFEKTSIES